jgi:hypothetical protein
LTPYSPNLNPIERLWKLMNEYARNNKYFARTKEIRHQINYFFDVTLPRIADSLNGRINDNFQVGNYKFYKSLYLYQIGSDFPTLHFLSNP